MHKIKAKEISVNFDFKTTCFVKGSANHLEQVFVNLILNSLDAISERKESEPDLAGEIKITLKYISDKIYVHLKDNGMGIPDELKAKIFNPFFTSKKVGKGTGLGLSVSFNLIKEHKGNISFSSREGFGTEFVIELPSYT